MSNKGAFWTYIFPFIEQSGDAGVTEHDIASHMKWEPTCLRIKDIRQQIRRAKFNQGAPVYVKQWVDHIQRTDERLVRPGSMYSHDPVWVVGTNPDVPHPHQDRINLRHARRDITLAAKAKDAAAHAAAVERVKKYNPGGKIPENWGETPWIRKVDAQGTKIPTQIAQDCLSAAMFGIVKSGVYDHADDDEANPGEHTT